MTESEIQELPLTDEQRANLTSAEVYSVTYVSSGNEASSDGLKASTAINAYAEEVKTRKVYLLTINGRVFYLDPIPQTGDELSKSYYDSVLDFENYKNSTLVQTNTTTVSAQGQTMTMQIKTTVKIDNGKCYYETMSDMYGQTQYAYYYLEETDSGIKTYASSNGSDWTQTIIRLTDGTTVRKISDLLILCQYDYSYLEKTNTGFTLQQRYFEEYVGSALSAYSGFSLDDAFIYYYVSNGAVVKCYGRISATLTVDGVTGTINADSDALISDIGTTTVSVNIQ